MIHLEHEQEFDKMSNYCCLQVSQRKNVFAFTHPVWQMSYDRRKLAGGWELACGKLQRKWENLTESFTQKKNCLKVSFEHAYDVPICTYRPCKFILRGEGGGHMYIRMLLNCVFMYRIELLKVKV